jgi:cytochrome oxidase Cu insertion factor (SCO1/SenC/PrrC family)
MKVSLNTGAALLAAFLATTALPGGVRAQTPAQQTLSMSSSFDGLLRHDGTVFNRRQLAGKPTLLFFGFVSCGTICPTALNTITLAAEELEKRYGKDAVPNLLFVTTLPGHEGADQIAAFLKNFDSRFIGLAAQKGIEALSGDRAALAKVQQIESVLEQFRAVRLDHHSPFAYVMGADGRFIGKPLNTQDSLESFVRSIAATLKLDTDLAAKPSP